MNKHRSVLIVFAMDEEISAFFNSTTATKTGVGMLENIYMDCLGDTTIYGMKGGVGKVNGDKFFQVGLDQVVLFSWGLPQQHQSRQGLQHRCSRIID